MDVIFAMLATIAARFVHVEIGVDVRVRVRVRRVVGQRRRELHVV